MKKVTKAIIPAAGFGTRFLPQTKAMPKEMLPIVDKPVIQYVVEECVDSGIKDVIIVTGYGKRAIEDHIDIPSSDRLILTMPGGDIIYNFDVVNKKITRLVGINPIADLNSNKVEATGNFSDLSYQGRAKNINIHY